MDWMPYPQYRKLGWQPSRVPPAPRLQPKSPSKFRTDLKQHRQGRLIHNLKWGFPLKRGAVDPQFMQDWIKKNGPYLYHGTSSNAVKPILQEGLYPHDYSTPNHALADSYEYRDPDEEYWDEQPNSRSDWQGGFLEPRAGHVYLGTHKYASNYGNDGTLLKVDLRKLDHSKINADEDHFSGIGGNKSLEHLNYMDRLDQFGKGAPVPMHWHAGDETLGQWADRSIGGDPEATTHSLNSGSVAYNGHIPPEAVSMWTPADRFKEEENQNARQEADDYLYYNTPYRSAEQQAPIHDAAATYKTNRPDLTWGQAYNSAVFRNGSPTASAPELMSQANGIMDHLHDRLGETPAPSQVAASWHFAKTDAKHFEARMYHHSEKGLMRGIKTPFLLNEKPHPDLVSHEYSVTLRKPFHVFVPFMQAHLDAAKELGSDGIVSHTPEGMKVMVTDPGAVVPGHDHDFPYK